ncbi:DUF2771 domain-containing protein [Mycobacterium sp. MYCO198283]|uniref:DUF2771 domain-containing protein n=1 Tax=Mycobacterium sp. MYCO198283 TaxID=2883505 RepID=UPI001E3F7A36|nr:DUF2771 domain-containing protein [Mycobacterium sp. MYCO198283]MCG5431147.1 DUF2771 domain-containing protein [Mycobacterium sp. MYCO198283]
MSRRTALVLLALTLVSAVVTGAWVWTTLRDAPPRYPDISVYSRGDTVRVGPIKYCRVDLSDCRAPGQEGTLRVAHDKPVQLSVDHAISEAPWRMLRFYEDGGDPVENSYPPNSRLAVTVPTVDPQRGRLQGIGVYLPTLVLDPRGEIAEVPHAEWSVRTVWD